MNNLGTNLDDGSFNFLCFTRVFCDARGSMGMENDERHGHFATVVVWNGHDACIGDLRDVQQTCFQFGGRHLESLDFHDFLPMCQYGDVRRMTPPTLRRSTINSSLSSLMVTSSPVRSHLSQPESVLRVERAVETSSNYPSTNVSLVLSAIELPTPCKNNTSGLTPPHCSSTQGLERASSRGARQAR